MRKNIATWLLAIVAILLLSGCEGQPEKPGIREFTLEDCGTLVIDICVFPDVIKFTSDSGEMFSWSGKTFCGYFDEEMHYQEVELLCEEDFDPRKVYEANLSWNETTGQHDLWFSERIEPQS